MLNSGLLRIAAFGALLALASERSIAHTPPVDVLSDERLAAASQVIVEAKITRLESLWNADETQIHTFVDVEVLSILKGDVPGETIRFAMLGGTVGEITMAILDAPSFAVEEEVVLFLRPNYEERVSPIVGFNQGKLTIAHDINTNEKKVEKREQSRDEYLAKVKRIVAAQTPKEVARDDK